MKAREKEDAAAVEQEEEPVMVPVKEEAMVVVNPTVEAEPVMSDINGFSRAPRIVEVEKLKGKPLVCVITITHMS